MTLLARSLLRALGETNRRRLASLVGLATVLTWLAVLPATACKESIDSMVGYRNAYGELLPERDEQAKRAHEIFQRLLDAARPQVTLRLLITMTDDFTKPFACAIPDGSIILSKGVLRASYRDPARGDDLLAFVLAHEIAHHEKRDFWHRQFAQAIEASQADLTDPQQREGPQRLVDFVNQMDERLVKEAQADEFGIFYASLAGFNTYRLVFEDNKFLEDWIRSLDPRSASGNHGASSHPPPEARARAVKQRLQDIVKTVDLFQLGIWFYQAGQYDKAVEAFWEFQYVFPSREVYHNLAASHHQLALRSYRQWKNVALDLPWKLSLVVDPVTRASGPRDRAEGEPPERRFKRNLDEAIKLYRRAISHDPSYMLSYNNLGCALLLTELTTKDVYEAITMFLGALEISPNSAEVLNNLGVAFSYNQKPDEARQHLAKAHELAPAYEAPLFNLGRLAHQQQNEAEAKKYWMDYLQLDPVSPWAHAIRQTLSLPIPSPALQSSGEPRVDNLMGLEVGDTWDSVLAQWGEPESSRAIHLGTDGFILAMYRNGVRFLVEVEKHGNGVWSPLRKKIIRMILSQEGYSGKSKQGIAVGSEEADVRAQYGFPSRILSMPQWTSWVYEGEGIVFQLREGKVVSWQLF